jgi:hypothetical protein
VNNEESGPKHQIWQTPGDHFNGSSISTLLEGYCRESIKRPIGGTPVSLQDRRAGSADPWRVNPIEVAKLCHMLA